MDKPNLGRNFSNTSTVKPQSTTDLTVISDQELSHFQKMSKFYTVSDSEKIKELWRTFREGSNSKNGKIVRLDFINLVKKHFKLTNDNIPSLLFKRFGIRRYTEKGQTEIIDNKIELHDIILAITLLSRMPYEKKLELVFDLTDVDEDGCLSPDEIFRMIEGIERVFAKENSDIKLDSRILQEELSREKAIRKYDWAMKSVGQLESRCMKEDGLVTFQEFNEVLIKMPLLRSQFLPRYTDLKSVLRNAYLEPALEVSDERLEDFLVFRYEMQALFSDSVKSARKRRWRELAETQDAIERLPSIQKPAKKNAQPDYVHKECPGLVRTIENRDIALPPGVWEYNSMGNKVYVRESNIKNKIEVKQVDRDKALAMIIPERPVKKALEALKRQHENEHTRNEDEEAVSCEALISKVNAQVEDTKRKKKEIQPYIVIHPNTNPNKVLRELK